MVAQGKARTTYPNPALEAPAKTLKTMSTRVHEAQQQGTIGDAEIVDLLANLDITWIACRGNLRGGGSDVVINRGRVGCRRGVADGSGRRLEGGAAGRACGGG